MKWRTAGKHNSLCDGNADFDINRTECDGDYTMHRVQNDSNGGRFWKRCYSSGFLKSREIS